MDITTGAICVIALCSVIGVIESFRIRRGPPYSVEWHIGEMSLRFSAPSIEEAMRMKEIAEANYKKELEDRYVPQPAEKV